LLLIPCPYCGPRPELEFAYGGQAHLERPARPDELSDEQWEAYVYLRANSRGPHPERWRHLRGCGRFFNVVRDTTTDRILASYRIGETPPAKGGAA
jgi:sarcosine oxidase, subunit delta